MSASIKLVQSKDSPAWEKYASGTSVSNPYYFQQWQQAIQDAYGHKGYGLAAFLPPSYREAGTVGMYQQGRIAGILPIVHLNSFLFGRQLVSIPFFDHGGIIADSPEIEKLLIRSVINLGRKLKVHSIELRHLNILRCLNKTAADHTKLSGSFQELPFEVQDNGIDNVPRAKWSVSMHKVRLLMPLPDSSETLMNGFKSKLRSQINRPMKAGLYSKIGGTELLEDFYEVFSINMRDLGSPVHSKSFIRHVLVQFEDKARIVAVYAENRVVAASIMIGFKDLMINPWASALREYSKLSPNMLLYWRMLAFASDNGYRYFDFGRSTSKEGTYRFKTQWGATAKAMYWYTIFPGGTGSSEIASEELSRGRWRAAAEGIWKNIPIRISQWIGPLIRKHISL